MACSILRDGATLGIDYGLHARVVYVADGPTHCVARQAQRCAPEPGLVRRDRLLPRWSIPPHPGHDRFPQTEVQRVQIRGVAWEDHRLDFALLLRGDGLLAFVAGGVVVLRGAPR